MYGELPDGSRDGSQLSLEGKAEGEAQKQRAEKQRAAGAARRRELEQQIKAKQKERKVMKEVRTPTKKIQPQRLAQRR